MRLLAEGAVGVEAEAPDLKARRPGRASLLLQRGVDVRYALLPLAALPIFRARCGRPSCGRERRCVSGHDGDVDSKGGLVRAGRAARERRVDEDVGRAVVVCAAVGVGHEALRL